MIRAAGKSLPLMISLAAHAAAGGLMLQSGESASTPPRVLEASILYEEIPAEVAGTPASSEEPVAEPRRESPAIPGLPAAPKQPPTSLRRVEKPRTVPAPARAIESPAKPSPPEPSPSDAPPSDGNAAHVGSFSASLRHDSAPLPGMPGGADRDGEARPLAGSNPQPRYPEEARRRRLEGRVLLHVHVDDNGRAGSVSVLEGSGASILDKAAVEAVSSWRFVPARRGGTATASVVEIPVRFKLSR